MNNSQHLATYSQLISIEQTSQLQASPKDARMCYVTAINKP